MRKTPSAEQTTSCGNRAAGARLGQASCCAFAMISSFRHRWPRSDWWRAAVRRGSDAHFSVQGDALNISHQRPCHLRCSCQNKESHISGFIFLIVRVAVLSRGVRALIWAFASVFVLYWIARSEESDLERIFGKRYLLYKGSVPMFFPRF